MEFRVVGHAVFVDFEDLQVNEEVVEQIAGNTEETWQPDRAAGERGANTRQGKIAEDVLVAYLERFHSEWLSVLSYDEIRNDGLEKHAPFDELIWKTGEGTPDQVVEMIRNDIGRAPGRFVTLSDRTRRTAAEQGMKIVEIKSTKITDRLKNAAGFHDHYDSEEEVAALAETIREADDIFCYPHYKRSEANPEYTFADYCRYAGTREERLHGLEGEALRTEVISLEREYQCVDLFIRVYLDDIHRKGFIMGWIPKEELLDEEVIFKRMVQPWKSERALYYAKKLTEAKEMGTFRDAFSLPAGEEDAPEAVPGAAVARENAVPAAAPGNAAPGNSQVYASPYTRTDFYHRVRDCRFIRQVSDADLIIFPNEEAARAGGRYIHRCRSCFEG